MNHDVAEMNSQFQRERHTINVRFRSTQKRLDHNCRELNNPVLPGCGRSSLGGTPVYSCGPEKEYPIRQSNYVAVYINSAFFRFLSELLRVSIKLISSRKV